MRRITVAATEMRVVGMLFNDERFLEAVKAAEAAGVEVDTHAVAGKMLTGGTPRDPEPDIPAIKCADEKSEYETFIRAERRANRQEWRDRNRQYERQMRNKGRK